MKRKGEIIGIDRNPQLLRYARKAAIEAGLESLVSFHQSDAMKLDLEDNFADRVFCQAVLWTMQNPENAIREMIRVCKRDGLVGAIEGGFDSVIFYYARNERLSELSTKQVRAYFAGQRKLYGLDGGIGIKLPSLFQDLGLKRVRLDAYAYTWLQRNDRIPKEHKIRLWRTELKGLRHPSKRYRESLTAGGMTGEEIDEHNRIYMKYVKKVIEDADFAGGDTSMNAGIFFITTGIKR